MISNQKTFSNIKQTPVVEGLEKLHICRKELGLKNLNKYYNCLN